jgi:hypothetical protein
MTRRRVMMMAMVERSPLFGSVASVVWPGSSNVQIRSVGNCHGRRQNSSRNNTARD